MEKIIVLKEQWKALKDCMPGKKELRDTLKTLYISDKGYMAACDGRRLLTIAKDPNLAYPEPGAYKIIAEENASAVHYNLIAEKTEHEYPDVERVIPAPLVHLYERTTAKDTENFSICYHILLKLGRAINPDYIKPVRYLQSEKIIMAAQAGKETDHAAPLIMLGKHADQEYRYIVLPMSLCDDMMVKL
jgi:hypothetical protein